MANSSVEQSILYRLLTAIEEDPTVSQRRLSSEVGIAVGSVNWYLKRCVSRGLIKLRHAPVQRYLYYLTPKGFEEKARLTTDFFKRSLDLYRAGRQECSEIISACVARGGSQIFLAGDGDLAEIACLSGLGTGAEIKAVVDAGPSRPTCAGVAVFKTLADAVAETKVRPDAVILTDLQHPNRSFTQLRTDIADLGLAPDIIHIPGILKVKPENHEYRQQ